MNLTMATFAKGDEEDDEFFGGIHDDEEEDCCLAEQESRAIASKLSTIAYLDAFDDTKEAQLQEGFESGYRDVFAIASRLGSQLGGLCANAKFQDRIANGNDYNNNGTNQHATTVAREASQRFRAVMDQINRGQAESNHEDAKGLLLGLEKELNRMLSDDGNDILEEEQKS